LYLKFSCFVFKSPPLECWSVNNLVCHSLYTTNTISEIKVPTWCILHTMVAITMLILILILILIYHIICSGIDKVIDKIMNGIEWTDGRLTGTWIREGNSENKRVAEGRHKTSWAKKQWVECPSENNSTKQYNSTMSNEMRLRYPWYLWGWGCSSWQVAAGEGRPAVWLWSNM